MNKEDFIKEFSSKLNLSENICYKINEVLESNFLIGKNNKEKIIKELKEKINLSDQEIDKIYNTAMSILKNGVLNKIKNPFKDLN